VEVRALIPQKSKVLQLPAFIFTAHAQKCKGIALIRNFLSVLLNNAMV
jgi:hypothetical protein